MFFGDGVITPAVSVLGAIEGLEVADEFVADCGAATKSPSGSVSVGGNGVHVCCRP